MAGGGATGIPRLTEATRLSDVPRGRARSAMALGTALAGRGEVHGAMTVLTATIEELPGHPDLVRTLRTASALLSDYDQAVRSEVYGRFREEATRSPELVDPAGRALLVQYESSAGLLSAGAAMARIKALLREPADPLSNPIRLGAAASVALWADELDEAERLVRRALAEQSAAWLHPVHAATGNGGSRGESRTPPRSRRRRGTPRR
ncbi:hypothetical protein [Actinacidiphila paucisporea]|uniref:Tetratricopeptide repeat protein n=1 Tax=Actinacidiphila paucisporea TaxID=310782 RepID=A0A1M7MQK3_9ACTN|nr:hypothetical protein [Actinacidiphila paucisporea]SHM93227.1 hypothetical protein SAMN05216499_116140 [Actinacidiphila paucisporea]